GTFSGVFGISPELETLFQDCISYVIGLVDFRFVPQQRLPFAELAALDDAGTELLATELEAARQVLATDEPFELSPRATLLMFPELPWVVSRVNRAPAPGLRVAAARSLTALGRPLTSVVDRVRQTWEPDDLRAAGPDLPWAIETIREHPDRFKDEVKELAAGLERAGIVSSSERLPTVFADVVLAAHDRPSRTLELTLAQSLRDLHRAIQCAFGWNLCVPCTFQFGNSFYSQADVGEAADPVATLLGELDLEKHRSAVYVFGSMLETVELTVNLRGRGLSHETAEYPRVVHTRGPSPSLDELFGLTRDEEQT
ncbi:MAG: hypothetical protein HY814_02460, partial [Candidatus Riflebacteria bacterium]|nr:hypothetical protein [Candidatus Riflebacteria bacterium]